ncbi:MAG: hypothetical protein V4663_18640 [Bacteroidota bacterium]
MEINYSIALLCLGFLAFLLFKEVKRSDKARLFGRILACVLMVTSFALFIIPITYSTKKVEPANELTLLTEGTSVDTILALKSAKTSHLANLTYHLKAHPEIKKINVYGYGLSDTELKMLKGYELSFHPSASPSGTISIGWPKKLNVSEQLIVQGVYHNSLNKAIKLKLFGFGTPLDSIAIKANTKVNFSFSTQPKQIGKAVFNLIALQNKDTLSAEPVPFEVLPKLPIRLLILATSPDFEYKFLKNWLFENQYTVAFRSRISKDKYSTEFLNRKPINLNQLNQTLLKEIDLAIVDEEELTPEIVRAVTAGMGLIVRAKAIKKNTDHQPLLTDKTGKVSVDRRLNGMGKIVTTTVSSTYEWQLAGKQGDYGRFWSLLFTKALRKKTDTNTYSIESKWPTVGEKTRLTISGVDTKVPVIWVDSATIAPRQNMELPFIWDGFFWPKTSGWITLSINQRIENVYTYETKDWKSVKNFDKLRATANFVVKGLNKGLKIEKVEYQSTEQVNKVWFFLIFLIAISFLWYEQRFLAFK